MQILFNLIIVASLFNPSSGMEVTLSLEDSTMSPVGKVAKLLEDMLKQMEKDADEDQDVADKMFCWCETGEKEKSKAIADNTQKVEDLKAEITALTAKSQKLGTEIEKIKQELGENEKSLEAAVSMRKKELNEFTAAEAATQQSIEQLTGAAAALSKNTGLMQTEVTLDDSSPAYHAIKHVIRNHGDMLWAMHNAQSQQLLEQMMTHHGQLSFLQTDSKAKITAPSDMIVGTINGMNDAFKENLKQLQSDENSAQNAHAAAKVEKEKEIEAAIALIDEKTGIAADTDEKNAADKEDLKDTTATLAADQEYLKNLQEQCEIFGEEFEARKKTRLAEIGACSKALEFLTSDEAKDLFTKTLGGTKRGEKLGSKNLAEFKESRDTESKRSQTNKARKSKWGTSERYLLAQEESSLNFLQVSSETNEQQMLAKEENELLALGEADLGLQDQEPNNVDAKKLATLAKRTQAYWAAQYYSDSVKAAANKAQAAQEKADMALKKHQEHLHHAHKHKHHKNHHKAKKHIGLTASQIKMGKGAMAAVGNGIGNMIDDLEMQQGEETSRNDWCVDEIAATEKALQKERQNKDRCKTKIKYNEKDIAKLKNEVKLLRYDQEDADIEVQKASKDRKKANSAFQDTVLNQINTGKLLKKALEVLEGFYKKKAASLLSEKARIRNNELLNDDSREMMTAADAVVNHKQFLSFKDAKAAEERYVAAASESELHAEMNKVSHERGQRRNEALLQTQQDSEDQREKIEERNKKISKWLDRYVTGPILLQEGETIQHSAQVAKMLKEAKASEADADAYIAQAERLAHPAVSLIQQEPAGPPPPGGFKSYEKSGSSGGVTVMLQNLIDDADAMVKEAVKDETEQMKGYEKTVADANAATEQRNKDIADRNARIGELEGFTAEENEKLKESLFKIKTLRQTDIDLHGSEGCDYLMKNYAVRHVERQEEIDSLKEANAILGGGGETAAEATGAEPTEPPLDSGLSDAMGEEEDKEEGIGGGKGKHTPVDDGVKIEGPGGETAVSKIGGR
eukprot:gnl/MRDRNA2_/MRDRNA2_94203_c0_seq1.p1 gnl/MRDRNA2_/MRDRNA2_94203_c0~~gnl/MRDRNA2_/MRDRNA2_94203_c0_seq1.p1  ORF type:complete len:1028 (+),score=370.57 gnl/MRDRNA2_/MRDRNA2_94203_c0_seq1:126-3209(+)